MDQGRQEGRNQIITQEVKLIHKYFFSSTLHCNMSNAIKRYIMYLASRDVVVLQRR